MKKHLMSAPTHPTYHPEKVIHGRIQAQTQSAGSVSTASCGNDETCDARVSLVSIYPSPCSDLAS